MATGRKIIVLFLIVLLTQSEIILAQQSNPTTPETWTAVKSLSTGSDIVVKLKNGKTIKGNHVEATDATLALSEGKKVSSINRNDVQKLHLVVERKRDAEKIIGAVGGAAAGVAISFAGENDGNPPALGVFHCFYLFAS